MSVDWNPSSGKPPGIVIEQPGRTPVTVESPTRCPAQPESYYSWLIWLLLLIILILLIMLGLS